VICQGAADSDPRVLPFLRRAIMIRSMKKAIIGSLLGGLLLVAWLAVEKFRDAAPRGEGSYVAAARIHSELLRMKGALPDPRLPDGYHRFNHDDGTWYAATGIDSHSSPDGGTVGILTSDGQIAIFFTHVCGAGEMPLSFTGETSAEVLANLRAGNKEWSP
jgi:hypothetical protein